MKISRKMKKFFISWLTVTLTVVMFATQVNALNVQTESAFFEHVGVVDALEVITWVPDRNWFIASSDLTCYECENVDYVYAGVYLNIGYYSSVTDEEPVFLITDSFGSEFTPLNTEDSDELVADEFDFDSSYPKAEFLVSFLYEIVYINGDKEIYQYDHTAKIISGQMSEYNRALSEHIYIYNVENSN